MSMTIFFEPAMRERLEDEATARAVSCEQIVYDAVEEYLQRTKPNDPEYEAFFRSKYEEGLAAWEAGKVHSHEEVQDIIRKRKAAYLSRIAGK